jgi:hypothetical protein
VVKVVVAIPLEFVALLVGLSVPRVVPVTIEKVTVAFATGVPASSITVAVMIVLLDGPRELPVDDNTTLAGTPATVGGVPPAFARSPLDEGELEQEARSKPARTKPRPDRTDPSVMNSPKRKA